jgi:hypothetical protein
MEKPWKKKYDVNGDFETRDWVITFILLFIVISIIITHIIT